MMAKRVQSKHPASRFLDRRLHPTFGSGSLSEAALCTRQGWGPRAQAHPCRLGSSARNQGGRPRDQEAQAGEAEAGAKSFQEQRKPARFVNSTESPREGPASSRGRTNTG